MTWFAKCHGVDCSVREQCRRYVEPAGDMQPWQPTPPITGADCPRLFPVVDDDDGS